MSSSRPAVARNEADLRERWAASSRGIALRRADSAARSRGAMRPSFEPWLPDTGLSQIVWTRFARERSAGRRCSTDHAERPWLSPAAARRRHPCAGCPAFQRSTAAFWWGPPARDWSPPTPGRASRTAHTWPVRL